ncbi:MAG: hypothetical protein ACI3Y2_00620 [Candidatus Egerieousia sp.]
MLTSILSAFCALALGAASFTTQADTVNVYILNDEKVANFDGSQLVGKTISDYKTMIATSSSNSNGAREITVTKVHMIRTDGKQVKNQVEVNSHTLNSTTAKTVSTNGAIVGFSVKGTADDSIVYYIDGKKSTKEKMNELKPKDIASITVYKAGGKEAVEMTKDKNIGVIKIETKKK